MSEHTRQHHLTGVALLAASVLLSAAGHLVLRWAAGGADGPAALALRPGIYAGVAVYAAGTVLWILCLRGLDLSFAYPASALQIVIVYAGAAAILGERIPPGRLLGVAVILAGLSLLFSERRSRHA